MSRTAPGYQDQASKRTTFRIVGVVVFAAGLVLTVIAFADLVSAMGSDNMDTPKKFFLGFIGLPLMGVGGWFLQAGFGGAVAKYAAGELAPTAKQSLDYLGSENAGTRSCPNCGGSNDATAKFCDDCGTPLAKGCGSCGQTSAIDAKFCATCGSPFA
jgi:hypothetical protein